LAKNVLDKLCEADIKPKELNAETFRLRTQSELSTSQLCAILHLTLRVIEHSDPHLQERSRLRSVWEITVGCSHEHLCVYVWLAKLIILLEPY
jgi:hypothetical protein